MSIARRTCWILFLAALLLFGVSKSRENRRDIQQQQQWRELVDSLQAESRKEYERLSAILSTAYKEPDPRTALQDELNDGRPFVTQQRGEYEEVVWRDPEYNFRIELTFAGNRLVGSGRRWGTHQIHQLHSQPVRFSLESQLEALRQRIASIAPKLWWAAIIAALVTPRAKRAVAELSLAVALTAATGWALSPYYSLAAQGVFSNDSLMFAVFMIGGSVTLIACLDARRDSPPISTLRFGLKSLLIATTVLAVVMASRPFGPWAGGVLAASTAYYGAIRYRLRNGYFGI